MTSPPTRPDHRSAIVEAAASLLRSGGVEAVTTRDVARRAGVQAPAIYRFLGDKDGLFDAVAEHVFAGFVAEKAASLHAATDEERDPVDDLRAGWRTYIEFGLTNPDVYILMSDPVRARRSRASRLGREILAARVRRMALGGVLTVAESHAVELIHAAGTGVLRTLLATPAEGRDAALSDSLADSMFEAVLNRITVPEHARSQADGDRAVPGPIAPAVALRAAASELDPLTEAERRLLAEWLDRVIGRCRPKP